MKHSHLLTIFLLVFTSTTASATSWPPEVLEISYQVDHSDRIIVGYVSNIEQFGNHTVVTIKVDEWLMNPLPEEEIIVVTEIGTGYELVGEPKFTENETVILMLDDVNVSENRFRVGWGEFGKHPISDKEAISREIAKPEIPFLELTGGLAALVTVFLIYYWYRNRK
ncbi:hypothetical protein ACSAZK_04495 [Methanosarcina sp. Mfa9]|uniref:hypothetical protein n=1 Tax=Methanosarcina sp. Mfa9 TaxID=3439063 RepID=UPI003F827379